MRKTTSFFPSENQELKIKRNTPFANGITQSSVFPKAYQAREVGHFFAEATNIIICILSMF